MRLKLSLLFVFIITYSWSQSGSTKTFTGNGTFPVPAGVTSIQVQAWGGGGSGGGASGAPLLLGRGAAGGGGGAYASNTILVTPGTTLNVVVASQTAGTTGAGITGGNSTITGFESSILAAGGSGGDANNAGGSPVGGIGGTIAASAGSIKFAGANGGNGNSWNLLGLLLSSGAGGAGAGSGGAGGTAVSGLLLSNAPGNAGSPPGGAGSGAINSALGAAQIGGAGAAGRVIISYSCTNFSLTSTAATNVCGSTSTTSTVTLTGSAASLPVGNYVVTYNRSSPSATALTANLTVTSAGIGTFTATGLTTAGSSTITITNLTSESCSSNITTNNTATITVSPATVGGTVNGGTTITSGSTSGLLTLSGHTGAVIKWQSSVSPFTTWTDIANTATTYTSGPLTVTTQFRAVVQSGICTAVNAEATTVTVNDPPPTITLNASGENVCQDFFSQENAYSLLAYTATTGSPITYSIVWDADPENTFENVTDAALPASPITITVPLGTYKGIYTGTLTVKNAGGTVSSPGSVFSINVDYMPSIITSGIINEVETSTSSQNASLPFDGTVGEAISYSIDWDAAANAALLTDQLSTPFTWSSFGGIIDTIVIPANVPAGTYSGIITSVNETCSSSKPVSITINPAEELPTIALASSAADGCIDYSGEIVDTITTLAYSATTGDPTTYSIVWDGMAINYFNPVIDAVLPSSPIIIEFDDHSEPGTYTGTLTVKNANGTISSPGSVFSVTINYTPYLITTGVITSVNASTSSQNATLAYTNTGSDPTSYSIDWDDTANVALLLDQGDTPFAFSTSGGSIDTIIIPANVPAGIYSGTIYIYNGTSCFKSKGVSITINPVEELPTITLATSTENACVDMGYNGTQTTLSYSGTTGNPITYSIVWDSSPENFFVDVTDAVLPTSPITIIIPQDIVEGTYSGTLTVKDANGVSSVGSTFNLTIGLTPEIIIYEPINPVCASTNSQNATLPYFATESNPTSYFIDWDETANNAFLQDQASTPVTLNHNGGTIDSIIISANAQAGSYSGTLHLVEGFCTGSVPISIVINPSPKVPIIGEITPATNEDPTGSIAFSGLPSGTNWGLVLLSGGQQDFVTGGNTESVIIDQFPPGDYKFRVFYLDTNCSSDFTETVIVPSIIWERPTSKVTTTGTTDLKSAGNSITVGIDNKVINVEAPNQIIKEVFVFDVSGKLLYNKNKVLDSKLVIADLRSSNQVLVVRVVLNNNQSEVKKVIY